MNNQQRINEINRRLTAALKPAHLVIDDESGFHVGHAGAKSGAGHFAITITADAFKGLSKVKCHQLIYQALDDLIGPEIHALRIKIL